MGLRSTLEKTELHLDFLAGSTEVALKYLCSMAAASFYIDHVDIGTLRSRLIFGYSFSCVRLMLVALHAAASGQDILGCNIIRLSSSSCIGKWPRVGWSSRNQYDFYGPAGTSRILTGPDLVSLNVVWKQYTACRSRIR